MLAKKVEDKTNREDNHFGFDSFAINDGFI